MLVLEQRVREQTKSRRQKTLSTVLSVFELLVLEATKSPRDRQPAEQLVLVEPWARLSEQAVVVVAVVVARLQQGQQEVLLVSNSQYP